jgi:uncharacterized repeat protein (TIGR03987 family)
MLVSAIVLITLALVFYTTGVWAEHRNGTLHWWHVIAFGLGLTCDASGTAVMTVTAMSHAHTSVDKNPLLAGIMATTGSLALSLMALHLVWAIITMVRNDEASRKRFHRFSLIVWSIWLVPYVTGMLAAML